MRIIEIPCLFPTFNDIYAGKHWSKRKKWKDETASMIGWYLKEAKVPKLKTPISIEVIQTYIYAKRDFDSSAFALKVFTDTLVKMGLIPNDTPEYVECGLMVAPQKTGKETTIFTIHES